MFPSHSFPGPGCAEERIREAGNAELWDSGGPRPIGAPDARARSSCLHMELRPQTYKSPNRAAPPGPPGNPPKLYLTRTQEPPSTLHDRHRCCDPHGAIRPPTLPGVDRADATVPGHVQGPLSLLPDCARPCALLPGQGEGGYVTALAAGPRLGRLSSGIRRFAGEQRLNRPEPLGVKENPEMSLGPSEQRGESRLRWRLWEEQPRRLSLGPRHLLSSVLPTWSCDVQPGFTLFSFLSQR
ncbi:hypothetical protein VULLAG_LOCUS18154 [Vulpes lagopus]